MTRGDPSTGRNLRDVWTIPTYAYKDAHFATFPPRLVEPCIKAGTSECGCCPKCRTPWRRLTKRTALKRERPNDRTARHAAGPGVNSCGNTVAGTSVETLGWEPGCSCGCEPVPCVVLDPFAGAGTTMLVADRLGRRSVGIELSPEYAEMARKRIEDDRDKRVARGAACT